MYIKDKGDKKQMDKLTAMWLLFVASEEEAIDYLNSGVI